MKKRLAFLMASLATVSLASCSLEEASSNVASSATPSSVVESSAAPSSVVESSAAPSSVVESSATPSSTVENVKYTIRVYDIDGELLNEKEVTSDKNKGLFYGLDSNFDVVATDSSYGKYITKVDRQITDANYYVSLYENGIASQTGIDGIVLDENDVFDFKMECWNTVASGYGVLDEYDVLVDKAIYSYAKTYMQTAISNCTTFKKSDYWTFMSLNMMSNYDKSVFNTNNVTQALKDELAQTDVNTLTGTNIGKYYYYASALGLDLTAYKQMLTTYLTDTVSTSYNEWSTPYIVSPAYKLGISTDKLTELANTTYQPSTQWGTDGICSMLASNAMFKNYDNSVLNQLTLSVDSGANGTTTALKLLPYAALGVSPRTKDNGDLIKALFDEFYDETLKLVKVNKADSKGNMSTNQIYASLMAYKVARDSGAKAYIFA